MLNLPTEYFASETSQKGIDLDTIQAKPSTRRALIIDDDPDTVDLIKIIFRNAGMDVIGAFSGREAIEKCADTHPTVILLDLMMPDMDGWETFQSIRQMTDVPVIVVSADTKKENVVKGLNIGFDDYVTKPFFPPELIAQKEDLLKDRVAIEMKRYFNRDFKRIGHATRVARYAEKIGKSEGGNLAVILSSAYLHDIGIKEAERKHNSSASRYQEEEGPGIAREILESLGAASGLIDEVCDIVGHHHHPREEETVNFKVLYDSDLITNLEEKQKEEPPDQENIKKIIKTSLLTNSGKKLAQNILLN